MCLITADIFASEYENKIKSTPLYKSLENAKINGGIAAVNKLIDNLEISSNSLEILSLWARNAYHDKKRNPRYGLIYADALAIMAQSVKSKSEKHYAQFMDTGSLMFFSSQLIAREDVARCKDNSAGLNYIASWSNKASKSYIDHISTFDESQMEMFYKRVTAVSNSRDLAHKDKSACAGGMSAMSKALENDKCDKKTGACNGSDYVELIPMKYWATKREDIQTGMYDYLMKKVSK
jgi:hypothetical protein